MRLKFQTLKYTDSLYCIFAVDVYRCRPANFPPSLWFDLFVLGRGVRLSFWWRR